MISSSGTSAHMSGLETVVVVEAASAVTSFSGGILIPDSARAAVEHSETAALINLLFIVNTPLKI